DDDVVSAAHKRAPRELPRFERLQRPAATAMLSLSLVYMLTAFPVYPQAWTLPLAAVVAALYWRWPVVATSVAAALCLPAFWNYSQAAALIYAPLTALGIGPAVVLVAATAPTPRRRAAEAAAGGLVAIVTAPLIAARATQGLPSANSPLVYLTALERSPATVVVWLAVIGFSVLLPVAWAQA